MESFRCVKKYVYSCFREKENINQFVKWNKGYKHVLLEYLFCFFFTMQILWEFQLIWMYFTLYLEVNMKNLYNYNLMKSKIELQFQTEKRTDID